MNNNIDRMFKEDNHEVKVMAHAIAGYPDLKKSFEIILNMANNGADLFEIQIPFTDPMADGPTIMTASQIALNNGITPQVCFGLISQITPKISAPVLVMTYFNIPLRMGVGHFVSKCAECGASGVILPDLPYDVKESELYYRAMATHGLYPIHVLSPGMEDIRLKDILKISKGFVYTTLKVGITGAFRENDESGFQFIKRVRKISSLPILSGFGISTKEQVDELKGVADGVIVGSYLIDLYNQSGLSAVGKFIHSLK